MKNALASLGVTPFNGYGDMSQQPEQPMQQAAPAKRGGMGNALATFGGAFFEGLDPQGQAQARDKRQTAEMAEMLKSGNYGGAAGVAYDRGDVQQGMSLAQYGQDQQAQKQSQMNEQQRQALGTTYSFMQNMVSLPVEQRAQFLQQNWQMMAPIAGGMDAQSFMQAQGGDLSDAALADDLAQLRTMLGQGPAAPDYDFKVVDGQLYRTDATAGEARALSERRAPDPSYATVTTADGVMAYNKNDPNDVRNLGAAPAKTSGITINNSPFGGAPKTLSDIPVGTPIPKDMLGGVALPADTVAVRADNGLGFEFIPVPGSETARKNMAKEEAGAGREYGLGSLVRSYTTLKNNNAMTSQSATAGENIGALYSGTGIGKLQDAIGGGVGNNENITARNTINGLSMKALMDMISMSDVSAKAMDSDAEMKAWLGAIKDDNYEAAMAKLHALDISFGGGDLMRKMFSEGSIDQDTYQLVTNRTKTDPQTVAMMKKMQRYSGLGESIGSDNLTPDEMSELEQLRRELGE